MNWRVSIMVIGILLITGAGWAGEPVAPRKGLGVLSTCPQHPPGDEAVRYLTSKGISFDKLTPEDLFDIERIKNYSALICLCRPDALQMNVLRAYLVQGGALYLEYAYKKDINGAIDATSGYSPGSCLRLRADQKHPITAGLKVGKWQDIEHPFASYLMYNAVTAGVRPKKNSCVVLLSVEVSKFAKTGTDKNGKPVYEPTGKRKTYPWLTAYRYGNGTVITGMMHMFRYANQLDLKQKSLPPVTGILDNLTAFLLSRNSTAPRGKAAPNDFGIKTATLYMEVCNSIAGYAKPIYINGVRIGAVPDWPGAWSGPLGVRIPAEALGVIATRNSIQILNENKGCFKIRKVRLEVEGKEGKKVSSNSPAEVLCSVRSGWSGCEGERAAYNGAPLPFFEVILPTDKTGFIPQPTFHYETPELLPGNLTQRKWPGLERAAIGRSATSTSCWIDTLDFYSLPMKEIVAKLDRFNSKEAAIFARSSMKAPDVLKKIEQLRQRGYRIRLGCPNIARSAGASALLPDSKRWKTFFDDVRFWAPRCDAIGCDEWFLSPALTKTDGGHITNLDRAFLKRFAEYSGLSEEDANWGMINWRANDPRAVKAWAFCDKVQNDLMREFVRVAKEANPKVKTWVSYITHNWNKWVTSIDSAVSDMDELLDCQTYWYARNAKDPLKASKITNAIGLGKLYQSEYPQKKTWLGFGTKYAGAKVGWPKSSRYRFYSRYYHNTAAEVVPYLATLYASSDGVFMWTVFNGEGPGDGSDEDFADMVRLVSSLVPRVKNYVKGEVAYYYDPQATWSLVRRGTRWAMTREIERVSLGLLQEFCDADVSRDPRGYKNVVCGNQLLPAALDYTRQNIYFMYAPEFNEKGEKASAMDLAKLGVKGFARSMTNEFSLSGDVAMEKMLFAEFKPILGANKPLRSLYTGKLKKHIVAAQNARGNIRTSTLCPYRIWQDAARKVIKHDLDQFGWMTRDCPQINGVEDNVAVSFREPRVAVIDFSRAAKHKRVRIVVFNGTDGVIRNETATYHQGMTVNLPPLSVMVAHGMPK